MFLLIVLFIIGGIGYNYVYKGHRDISSERADFIIESEVLISEFVVNSDLASQKYLNKTIIIKGEVTEINNGMISLDDTVLCYMIEFKNDGSILNSKIVIKGRFIGYDDLLEELKIDQVSIVK